MWYKHPLNVVVIMFAIIGAGVLKFKREHDGLKAEVVNLKAEKEALIVSSDQMREAIQEYIDHRKKIQAEHQKDMEARKAYILSKAPVIEVD